MMSRQLWLVVVLCVLVSFAAGCARGRRQEALREAIVAGDAGEVKKLLHGGVDPNTRGPRGATCLHVAAYLGHVEVVRLLLEAGADVNVRDNDDRTPLRYAVDCADLSRDYGAGPRYTAIVALLRQHGAKE